MRLIRSLGLVLLLFMVSQPLKGQTCSCAGAPLISSQSLGTVADGDLLIGLTQEFHNISDLYAGDRELENQTQERHTLTSLLELNYGLLPRLSLTATFTYIVKSRTTGLQNPEYTETLQTSGIGDGLLMAKYSFIKQTLWKPYQLAAGGGVKMPIGSSSLKANGLALNADMQPGSGAWDGVGWLFASRTLRKYNTHIYTSASLRVTGENERFSADDRYKFGNELVTALGVTGGLTGSLSYNLLFKYRTTSPDQRNGSDMPSTGGDWLYVKPGLSYPISDRLSVQLSGEIPLYQDLNGTQPTTSYIISGSIFFSLNKITSGFIYGSPE